MNRISSSTFLLSLTTACCFGTGDLAVVEGPTQRLDDYIVEASPSTLERKAPAVTMQVLAPDLEALNLPETADALNYLPNLFVRKRFVGDKNALLSIRGTSNRQPGRTLVLADGILLSNFLGTGFGNSPRWFLIAPEEIEKIAISYGPFSALYAGNSIGGTVLFTTKMPTQFTTSAKVQLMSEAFNEYGTRGTFNGETAYLSVGDKIGRFSYFGFFNHLKNDSQPMQFNTVNVSQTTAPHSGGTPVSGAFTDLDFSNQPRVIYGSFGPTEATQDLYKIKLGYDLAPSTVLRYSLIYWRSEEDTVRPETYLHDAAGNPVWSGTVEAQGRTFAIKSTDFAQSVRAQADIVNAFVLSSEPEEGFQFTANGSLYDTLKDKTFASNGNYPSTDVAGPGLATIVGRTGWQSFDVKAGWRAADGLLTAHSPVVGYHLDHYFTTQDQINLTNWRDTQSRTTLAGGTGGETRTNALYAQDAWSFAPGWILTPGVRWEKWKAFSGRRSKDFPAGRVVSAYPDRGDSATSPKLALEHRPNKDWSVRLSLGKAYRFPTVGELFQGSVSANGSITQNDPNLQPERDFSKDLTVERTLPGGNVRLSVFEDDVHDALISQSSLLPDGTTFNGVQNVSRVRTRGAEASFERRRLFAGALDFSSNLSYTNAVILKNPSLPTSEGKQFPRIPHWQWKTVTTWHPAHAWSVSAATRYSSNQYNTLDNSDPRGGYGGVDNFFVADFKASYDFAHGTTASLGLDNATNRHYHVFHPMPGRTIFAELNWRL